MALTPQVVVEIGQAHDGSVGILHSLIDAIASTGAPVIKFQMHFAGAESSRFDEFRIQFSRVDATRFDYWKRMELSVPQWREIKSHCESVGCEFLCTPFSVKAVRVLDEIGASRVKVGSGDIGNHLLLEAIRRTGKPVILSSGMSTFDELDEAVAFFRAASGGVTVMQCTSEYPVLPERWGLNLIPLLRERYGVPVGLSDHSGTIFPSLAAVALGAELVEVHGTFDRRMFGPDASSSLEMEELKILVEGVRQIALAGAHPQAKSDVSRVEQMRRLFGRSLTASRDIPQGTSISFHDLEAAKPAGHGLAPSRYIDLLGKRAKRDLMKGTFILESDFE
ncbi:MAG: N-acetylneuraminate synthase family protein [Betaproteobacteria bacterium]|nr:N-acetylneuraminate synthase family protein [Betaproteobacteria bacterium]